MSAQPRFPEARRQKYLRGLADAGLAEANAAEAARLAIAKATKAKAARRAKLSAEASRHRAKRLDGMDECEKAVQALVKAFQSVLSAAELERVALSELGNHADVISDTEIAEIEDSMSDDFAGYQGDTAKQERYGALLEAQEAGTAAPDKPDAASARRGKLEAMMADQRSPYWKGSQSDRLQAEYRDLLGAERPAADQGEAPPSAPTDQAVQFTDSDVDVALADLGRGDDVAREWAADLGTGPNARNALRVVEDQRVKLLDAMGDTAADVQTAFEGLEENVQMACYREMGRTGTPPQPPATAEQVEQLMSLDHGVIVADEWGSETPSRLAKSLYRWERMCNYLTDDEADALHDYFLRMSPKERASIVQHLGA